MPFWEDIALQGSAIVLLIVGLWLAGNKNTLGPLLAAISEVLWAFVGIAHSVWGLVVLSVVLAVVQFRAYLKWKAHTE